MSFIPMELLGVLDRGKPNLERIAIKVYDSTELGRHFLGLGIKKPNNAIDPINDNSFWFGPGSVQSGDWIYVYTGIGQPKKHGIPNQENNVFTLHWGRPSVLFLSDEIAPFIYALDSVLLPNDMTVPSLNSE